VTEPQPPDTTAEPDLEIVRVFEVPRERIWREWTEPEAFADWYGGPQGEIPLETVSMDVRPGGTWRATMVFGGREIQWEGEYVEVAEPERLSFTVTDEPDNPERDLVTVVLSELDGDRTEMRMTQSGGHMSPEAYERAKQGWSGFFDRMDERLTQG
jgi:uncharacterized protein YndB with AHSA1/START domain